MKVFHKKSGPFLRSKNETSHMMNLLLLSLLPIILFSEFKNGIMPFMEEKVNVLGMLYPLFMIVFSGTMTYVIEYVCARFFLHKKDIELREYMAHSYAVLPGIFLALILPLHTPLSILLFGDMVAVILGKMVYGGFGNNVFNPALLGRLFIISAYALLITEQGGYFNSLEVDTVSGATPLANQVTETVGTYESLVAPYGNLWDFFIGTIPGALGETSVLLCILAFLFLTYHKVIKWRIPCLYITTVFLLTWLIGAYNGVGLWYPLFQILSGGLFFGAVFMATDPVTSPTTKVGQILYGLGLGILTVIFRYLTPYPEGVLTSILTMNMFVFICDKLGSRAMYHKCYQSSIIVMVILGLLGGYTVALRYQVTETIDSDYHILEKKIQGSVAEYVVTQKGYGGTIKASIKVQNGKVIQYTILEHNETFYQKVEAQNYIETLLDTQDPTIDAVSGATVTSTALKKMMQNTLEDYRKSHVEQSDTTLEIEKPKPIEKVTITDIERFDTEEIYHVTTKSFGGEIRLLVTVQEDKITNIEVVEQKDSYFFKVEEQDYIEKLIEQQDGLESLDTVSGATVSSTALKDAIMRVIEESRNDHEG